ncbi:hypothetical protein, partial [Salsipaludibacter albus]|uniref:hypothetical protein n=1 Tax=Salsipaludibacter albus TaxID=2849650 RepID=UPI001EE47E5D
MTKTSSSPSPDGSPPARRAESPRRRRPSHHRSALARPLVATFLGLALLVTPSLAGAQTLEDELDTTRSRLESTRGEIDATTAALSEVRDRIVAIDERLADADRRLVELEAELADLETEAEVLVEEMLELQEQVEVARGRITSRARRLYMHGGTAPVLAIFEATTTDMAVDKANTVARVAETDRAEAESAEAAQRALDLVVDELARKQGLMGVRSQEAAEVRDAIEADLDEAQGLRDGLADRADDLTGDASALEAEIGTISQRIEERDERRRQRELEEQRRREAEAQRQAELAAQREAEAEAARQAAA